MGRRQTLIRELLPHKYLDIYELARRTGIPHMDVSMVMATAIRDEEPIERIRKQVDVPAHLQKSNKRETVWIYRLKNQGCEIIQRGTLVMPNGDVKSIQEVTEDAIKKS